MFSPLAFRETEQDFQELKSWVEATKFERLGIFTYSHEENTHAFKLQDNISEESKKRRADEIMQVQQEISYQKNEQLIGKTLKVLLDKKEDNYFIGRTEYDSPDVDNEVLVKASEDTYVRIGDFANVKIIDSSDFDLYGEQDLLL